LSAPPGICNCALLLWYSARRIALMPRTRAGRVRRGAVAREVLYCALRCLVAASPFVAFQARPITRAPSLSHRVRR
jgi:hypothetical protein